MTRPAAIAALLETARKGLDRVQPDAPFQPPQISLVADPSQVPGLNSANVLAMEAMTIRHLAKLLS